MPVKLHHGALINVLSWGTGDSVFQELELARDRKLKATCDIFLARCSFHKGEDASKAIASTGNVMGRQGLGILFDLADP